MKYAWKIVAGEPGKPGGVVGIYQTKAAASQAWPTYSAHLVRIRVSQEVWEELARTPKAERIA